MSDFIRPLKRFVKILIGRDFIAREDTHVDHKRFGSEFGSWNLVVDILDETSIIYSVGIGEDVSFDLALMEATGATIHGFDPTPKSVAWVATQNLPAHFILHKYGIADFNGDVSFNPPANPEHVSHTILERKETQDLAIKIPVKTLKTIMNELQHSEIDVLKMDIEGAEYAVINDMQSTDIRPKQLLIEFHHRFPGVGIRKTKSAIKMIKAMGYGLFSVSESGEEFSFIRKNNQG